MSFVGSVVSEVLKAIFAGFGTGIGTFIALRYVTIHFDKITVNVEEKKTQGEKRT